MKTWVELKLFEKKTRVLKIIWKLKFWKLNLKIGVLKIIWKLFENWSFENYLKIKIWKKKNEELRGWRHVAFRDSCQIWTCMTMQEWSESHSYILTWSSLPTELCQYSSSIFSTDDSLVDWAKEDALQIKIQKDGSSTRVLMISSMVSSGSF